MVCTKEERQEEKEQASFEGKRGTQNFMLRPLMAERSWVGRASVLRRGPQEKAFGAPAVAVNEGLKQGPPADLWLPAKANKIAGYFLPVPSPERDMDLGKVVRAAQPCVGTPKPEGNYRQPTGNQPRGHQAIRVHRYRGPMKALLSHLPALDAQKQSTYHRIHGVLMVGNQLDRQHRKRSLPSAAHKTRNRNAFFLELREQVNGVSPVRANLTVATLLTTDRTGQANEGEKIDFLGKKRFLVFPNARVCVRVGKLNLSAPCPRGGRLWALTPWGLSPCGTWLFYQGQFLTS
jgi:hypothetical protein